MKIVVLAGGLSPERDVSLSSGTLISNALIENGHEVMLLDLFFGKNDKEFEPIFRNKASAFRYKYAISEKEPDLSAVKNMLPQQKGIIGDGVIEICSNSDIVFLALHGASGENGQIQAIFDLYGIKYTGTGYVGSLLAMDKDISKQIMKNNAINTADWKCYSIKKDCNFNNVKYPCVVKPCSCGSSVGIKIVENENQLKSAVEEAKKYEDRIIIEDKIDGREFSVGILNEKALLPIEIKPLSGFYDYKNKYQQGLTQEICPPDIDDKQLEILQNSALKVHSSLRLGYYSRLDFILDENNYEY